PRREQRGCTKTQGSSRRRSVRSSCPETLRTRARQREATKARSLRRRATAASPAHGWCVPRAVSRGSLHPSVYTSGRSGSARWLRDGRSTPGTSSSPWWSESELAGVEQVVRIQRLLESREYLIGRSV